MEDVNGFTVFQWILITMLAFGCIHYLWLVWEDRYGTEVIVLSPGSGESISKEGFSNPHGIMDSELSRTLWFENDDLFDDFYASIYDNLTQLAGRYPRELALIINEWKKTTALDAMDVLDCGSGTGIATVLFARQGVNSVVGLDKSEHMLRRARNVTLLAADLPKEQREAVQFIQGDMLQEMTFSPGQFSHASLLFFTFYYVSDTSGLFRNLYHWIRPGGQLAIEVVNKYKFDPMLESASPFLGTSVQKYSKKRVTKSKVEFDKFSYEADFELKDPEAEFRETFRFKDKSVRRQRHTFNMKDVNEIVKLGQMAGWNYNGYIDLITAGFEYAYILMFTHP